MATIPGAVASRSSETMEKFDRFVVPNYKRYPVCLTRGEGSRVWDAEGREYLDLFPGWGCNILGHCPSRVVDAVREQAGRLIHVPNTWYMEEQGAFAEALSTRSFGGLAFFSNSGAEANEAAIKMARAHQSPRGRHKIITMEKGFHGRTYGAMSATAQPKYHEGFEPIVPGFTYVRYNDLEAASRAMDEETAAVMVEPIQGEGGVNVPSPGYLEGLRRLCDERGALLILDEVQTGMGRTGRWFAYQHHGIEPDVLTCAKALAGGVAAGVTLAKREVAESLRPGMHASTFGGNPIACRAGLAVIETIEAENLLERAGAIAARFRERFEALRAEIPGAIGEIRTRGVMIGVDLGMDGTRVVAECMERGVLVNATQGTVLRLLPALNVDDESIDRGCAVIGEAIRKVFSAG